MHRYGAQIYRSGGDANLLSLKTVAFNLFRAETHFATQFNLTTRF